MLSNYAYVLRDNKWDEIKAEQLTIGDILRIQTGEVVPADIRIVKSNSFSLMVS